MVLQHTGVLFEKWKSALYNWFRFPESALGETKRIGSRVCLIDDLSEGEKAFVIVEGRPVLLKRIGLEVKVFQGWCPHQGYSLGNAEVNGCVLKCRAHLWEYDMRTGKGISPRNSRLRTFPVTVDAVGQVFVDVGD